MSRPQKGSQGSCGPLGRQTQTRMRWNFEEEKNYLLACVRCRPSGGPLGPGDGPPPDTSDERTPFFFKISSHACLCLSPQGATAPLAAFLGPQQKMAAARLRGRSAAAVPRMGESQVCNFCYFFYFLILDIPKIATIGDKVRKLGLKFERAAKVCRQICP